MMIKRTGGIYAVNTFMLRSAGLLRKRYVWHNQSSLRRAYFCPPPLWSGITLVSNRDRGQMWNRGTAGLSGTESGCGGNLSHRRTEGTYLFYCRSITSPVSTVAAVHLRGLRISQHPRILALW